MICDMKMRGTIPDLIAILCLLGVAVCLWAKIRGWGRNLPDPFTYAFMLASLLVLTFRLRKLMNRITEQQSRERSGEQFSDKIDDAQ
jgi:hypothetical protein